MALISSRVMRFLTLISFAAVLLVALFAPAVTAAKGYPPIGAPVGAPWASTHAPAPAPGPRSWYKHAPAPAPRSWYKHAPAPAPIRVRPHRRYGAPAPSPW